MGVMIADFFLIRGMRLKLSELYKSHGDFWYFGGVNWRALLAWVVGWVPGVGGLALTSNPELSGPRVLYQLYFVAFFYGNLKFTFSLSILTHRPRILLQPSGLLRHKPGIPSLPCWRYG